ncbi:MAG: hypothetical protein KJZ60_11965, partial [Ignavibacteriaceae bacterium]|nr:hypothetical protein [Ignavibacteriaceae bacterium]
MKLDNFLKYSVPIFMALTVLRMFREMYWLYYATQLTLLLFILIIVKELWQKKLVLNKKTIQMFGI